MRKSGWQMAVFLFLVLVISTSAWAERPLRILVVEPFSGPMKDNGDRTLLGVQFAAEEVNAQGGVLGRKVEVVGEDSQMKPDMATTKAQKYLLQGDADILLAGSGTPVSKALAEATKPYNVLFINLSLGDEATGKEFAYHTMRTTYSISMNVRAMVAYLAKDKEFKRIYLLNPDYSMGIDAATRMKKEIARQMPGAQVVGDDVFPLMTMDFSPLLSKIKAANADVVLTAAWGSDISIMVKQRKELGVRAVIAGYALADWPKVRANPEAALGNIVAADYMVTVNTKENAEFKKRWERRYKGQAWFDPDPLSYRAYLATAFALEGIKKAKAVQVNKLMPVLEGMHYKSPMGDIYLRACDHQAQIPFAVARVTSIKYPYYGTPTIIPASSASIEENETGNPRCGKK